jgi:putative hydrolase of the HAD superfamily
MIGDQLDRDILPAKEAGLITIYLPGGFRPKWSPLAGGPHPDYEIASFWEAVDIIAALERKESLDSKAV